MRHDSHLDNPSAPDSVTPPTAETALAVMMDLGRTVWPENDSLRVRGELSDRIRDMLARNKAGIISVLTVTTETAPHISSEAVLWHLLGRRFHLLWTMEESGRMQTPEYERAFYCFRVLDIRYRSVVNQRLRSEETETVQTRERVAS